MTMQTAGCQRGGGSARGFTLIELMIAVAVLIAVIIATSKIFSTASRITGVGQATASVMQEAAVIERRLRRDLEHLSTEGFFAIRQVAVPNDVNAAAGGVLLNPALPPGAIVRADQLVFFTTAVEQAQTARINEQGRTRGQGTIARVYYGPAFQLPDGEPYEFGSIDLGHSFDPDTEVLPWQIGTVNMNRTRTETGGGGTTANYTVTQAGTIDGTQPEARQWLLARQPVILVDDDQQNANADSKTVFLGEIQAERSIFLDNIPVPGEGQEFEFPARQLRNGRMDAAATRMNDVRKRVRFFGMGPGQIRNWDEQRDYISTQGIYYPRAERTPPSMHRVDQALTNHVIGSAVSSFIVEWTYEEGDGDVFDRDGRPFQVFDSASGTWVELVGFRTNWFAALPYQPEQPWFGLNVPERGVGFYGWDDDFQQPGNDTYQEHANFYRADTIYIGDTNLDNNIERFFGPGSTEGPYWPDFPGIRVYEAIFGFNGDRPVALNPVTGGAVEPFHDLAYTPWPSAIRVTMVLHDPGGVLENGREFQFVIDLPKRTR